MDCPLGVKGKKEPFEGSVREGELREEGPEFVFQRGQRDQLFQETEDKAHSGGRIRPDKQAHSALIWVWAATAGPLGL